MKSQQIYVRNGNVFKSATLPDTSISSSILPPNVYKFVVTESMMGVEYSFNALTPFSEPNKYYGNLVQTADHITHYRLNNKGNLGVLLHGISGTGKSLLAKRLCNQIQKETESPIIIIDQSSIEHLGNCIQLLNTPCIFLLDEFEKLFDNNDEQNALLSILDGVYQTNHTFILTANDNRRINKYMFGRPSRIRYAIEYDTLDAETVEEVLQDLLIDKTKVSKCLTLMLQVEPLSFDIITQFASEVNNYPDMPLETLIGLFNIVPDTQTLSEKYIVDSFEVLFVKFL